MKKVTYEFSNLFSLKKYNDSNLNCQSYNYMTKYGLRSAILGQVIQQDGLDVAKDLFHKVKNAVIYIQHPKKYKTNNIQLKRFSNNSYNYDVNTDMIYKFKNKFKIPTKDVREIVGESLDVENNYPLNNLIKDDYKIEIVSVLTELLTELTNRSEEDLKESIEDMATNYYESMIENVIGTHINNSKKTMGFRQYKDISSFTFYIDNSISEIDRYLKGIDWLGTSSSLVYLKDIEEVELMENVLMKWDKKEDSTLHENYDWGSKSTFNHVYMYGDLYDKRGKVQARDVYVVKDIVNL